MPSKRTRVGAVQLRILRVLWKHGRTTARQITKELSQEAEIAHSTVQTLLRKLEAKGTVAHEKQERTFVYHPLVTEGEVVGTATKDLLSRVFDGSAYGLVAHLVRSERLSQKELSRIRALIREQEDRK